MTVEHKNITNAELHEPKDVSAASINKVYVADGAASGAWAKVSDIVIKGLSALTISSYMISDGAGGFSEFRPSRGFFNFNNIASPYTLTYPATYTKVAPTTTASGGPIEFTEATTSRLTYTGTPTKHVMIEVGVSFDQSVGANRDIRFAIFKNGSIITHSEIVNSTVSGNKGYVAINGYADLVTNDYLELFSKNDGASGDIKFYTLTFHAVGIPG